MPLLGAYETPLVLAILLLGPTLFPRLRAALTKSHTPRAALTLSTKALLAAHTALLAYTIAYPPPNIFLSSSLSLTSPFVASAYEPAIASKLSSLAQRLAYARFGHASVVGCEWCTGWEDYTLVALPGMLKFYVAEAVFLGVLSVQYYRPGTRAACVMVLCAMALAELAALWFWEVKVVEGDALHLFTNIHIIRNAALLLMPALYLYLPSLSSSSISSSEAQAQVQTQLALEALTQPLASTLQTLRLNGVAFAAVRSTPALRQEQDGSRRAREDKDVQKAVRDAGLDLRGIRERARAWVEAGLNAVGRPEQ